MQIAAITPARSAMVKEFNDLRSTLERLDAGVTEWQRAQYYPSEATVSTFSTLAQRLATAADGFRTVVPSQSAHAAQLVTDALQISEKAGRLGTMNTNRIAFGNGWSKVLDTPIADVVTAINLLLDA